MTLQLEFHSSAPKLGAVNGHPVFMVDGKPIILLAGEVHNSSSSSLEYMEQVWEKAEALGMNCLLLPVTWELVEPEEGRFDFSLVQGLIEQARVHRMKIAFLWFGSWKNAQCYYAPSWVKTDTQRFRRAEIEKGKGFIRIKDFYGIPYTSLSYLCEETMQADARAFGRLMAFIRELDSEKHTVVSVQIENETGVMGAAREHSDEADKLFASPVPCDFAEYMHSAVTSMTSDMKQAVENGKVQGSWSEVFGPEAEEVFSAYHIARYVNAVAYAGKKEYPLQGACLVLRENEDDFLILVYEAALNIESEDPEKPGLDFTLLEEGRFENGLWHRGRRLNGDEAVGNAYSEPTLLHIQTFLYK